MNGSRLLKLALSFAALIAVQSSPLQGNEVVSYSQAYTDDTHWPAFVTPLVDVYSAEGTHVLYKGIRTVLTRAYPDGQLALVDRNGTILVDHQKTDFLVSASDAMWSDSKPDKLEGNGNSFLFQIGRRVFDIDYDVEKAVPEAALKGFDEFIICRVAHNPEAVQAFLQVAANHTEQLKRQNIELIVLLDTVTDNQRFHEFLVNNQIVYPTVVPIFNKGFTDAVFTERENSDSYIRLKISGKITDKGNTLDDVLQ